MFADESEASLRNYMKYVLKLFFSFNDEASRKEWWIVRTVLIVLIFLMVQLDQAIYDNEDWGNLSAAFVLLTLWPFLAIDIKRWANRGKSPYWIMINFLPVIGGLWSFIELGFVPEKKYDPWMD